MPAVDLSASDLLPFTTDLDAARATALIQGVVARTAVFAPDILDSDFAFDVAAKDLLMVAVLRRLQSSGGSVSTETIGPYSVTVDNSALTTGGLYTDAELEEWARITRLSSSVVATAVPVGVFPLPWASFPDPAVWRA